MILGAKDVAGTKIVHITCCKILEIYRKNECELIFPVFYSVILIGTSMDKATSKGQRGLMSQLHNGRVRIDHRGLRAWRVRTGCAMAAGDMACSPTSHMTTTQECRYHMCVIMLRSKCKYVQEFFLCIIL